MIPVFRPYVGEEEISAVSEVLRSRWWGLGPRTKEFENRFALYIGTKYAIGLNSGTSAIHLALVTSGVGNGDEVILPSLTFVSCAHAVIYCGATPVFADIEPDTLTLDPDDVAKKISSRTRAILCVHYGGHPCDMLRINEVTNQKNIRIIEDAAHACGSEFQGKKVGSLGIMGCFSFHAVKNLATGDGGMITCDDGELYKRLVTLRWLGITKSTWDRYAPTSTSPQVGPRWYYDIDELGYKYHMNDIQAAIGLAQLNRLDRVNERRRQIAKFYDDELSKIPLVQTCVERPWARSVYHLYVIRAPERDKLTQRLAQDGIATSVHYIPIHLYDYYKTRYGMVKLPVTEGVWQQLVTLPMFPELSDEELHYIVKRIKEFYT